MFLIFSMCSNYLVFDFNYSDQAEAWQKPASHKTINGWHGGQGAECSHWEASAAPLPSAPEQIQRGRHKHTRNPDWCTCMSSAGTYSWAHRWVYLFGGEQTLMRSLKARVCGWGAAYPVWAFTDVLVSTDLQVWGIRSLCPQELLYLSARTLPDCEFLLTTTIAKTKNEPTFPSYPLLVCLFLRKGHLPKRGGGGGRKHHIFCSFNAQSRDMEMVKEKSHPYKGFSKKVERISAQKNGGSKWMGGWEGLEPRGREAVSTGFCKAG